MTAEELDLTAARLEEIRLEEENLRFKLQEQIEEFGYTRPRAEKSKRLAGALYQLTVSRGMTTEIKDAEVERIRAVCPRTMNCRVTSSICRNLNTGKGRKPKRNLSERW